MIPPEERAELSPWLEELLEQADRRVFPDRTPLALHFPAANEPPERLVPPELFDSAALRLDEPVIDDPIDAFTFVGGPAIPPPIQPGLIDGLMSRHTMATESGRPRIEHTTATELPGALEAEPESTPGSGVHLASMLPAVDAPKGGDWPEDDTVLGRPAAGASREGTLGPGGALRLLWRVAALGLDAICELRTAEGLELRLTLLLGELRALDGPVLERVVDGLRRRGRATERPPDEAAAAAVLSARIDAGELGRFERDRLVREAREALLRELIASGHAEFTLRRLEDTEPGRLLARRRVLGRSLRAALVEAAREALSTERVAELLGPGGLRRTALAFGPKREAGLAPAELAVEVVELLARLEGHSVADVIEEAPGERGLAGLLYALVAGDALELREVSDESSSPHVARSTVTSLVEAAAALAEDADYFAVLGLATDADGGAIERAYASRRAELEALPLATLGLHGLELARDAALDALGEAHGVLSDARLRRWYARALAT